MAVMVAVAVAMSSSVDANEPRATAPGLLLPGTFTGDHRRPAGGLGSRPAAPARSLAGPGLPAPQYRALAALQHQRAPQFEILGNGNLRLLDQQGQRIESALPYGLTRAESFSPFEPKLTLRGMVLYFADAARFTECRSGRSFPVAMEADFVALQRAYLEARQLPQTPVLATVEGRTLALRDGAGRIVALLEAAYLP